LVGKIADRLRADGTHWMLVGALLAAVGAYLFQLIASRSLGQVRYAPIGTLWTIQYLTVSIFLHSVETYVARASLRPRAQPISILSGRIWGPVTLVAVATTIFAWVFRESLFLGEGYLAVVSGCAALSFGAFMIVRGRLAGAGRFKAYGLVTASESLSRLALAILVAVVAGGTLLFASIMPLGALAAAAWWFGLRRPAEPMSTEVPDGRAGTTRFLLLTSSANAITHFLLAGGPLVLAFLKASPAAVSILFVTLTAARLPIVFVFGGILSRSLGTFTRLADADRGRRLRRAVVWIATGTVAAAMVAGGLAAIAGSALIGLLFGAGFRPPWWVAAGATVGVLLATGGMVLNQVLVATVAEHRLPWPWFAGLLGAALTIGLVAGPVLNRVMAAFVTGEAIALAGLVIAIRASRRDLVPASADGSPTLPVDRL
jgi:O-antigen/teichoic acid export membrane protein